MRSATPSLSPYPSTDSVLSTAVAVREGVAQWMRAVTAGLQPGRYRFCSRSNLVPTSSHAAQFVTCFAVKAGWHTGLWHQWDEQTRARHVELIKSFQRPEGVFVDDAMQRRFRVGSLLDRMRGHRGLPNARERTVAAETRQSAATLLQVGERPRYELPVPHRDPVSVRNYIRSLDWRVPWDAGSHASHLIFFLHVNQILRDDDSDSRLDAAFEELDALRDPASGSWFEGAVDTRMRINGAMKVLTAYRWTGRRVLHAKELLDLALDATFNEDGCSFLNRLFVVQQAVPFAPGYRVEHVRSFALECFHRALRFRQADGGFSFYTHGAQRRYFDAYVSLGGRQSDMHGVVMLTWAIAISLELLGLGEDSGWRASTP